MLIKQVIDLRKVRNETLNFRTDPQDPVEPFHYHLLLYGAAQHNIFSSHIFHSILVVQVIILRKLKPQKA